MKKSPYKNLKYIAILLLCSYSSITKAQEQTGWFNRLDIGLERSFFTDIGIYNVFWDFKPHKDLSKGLILGGGTEIVINKETLVAPKITASYIYGYGLRLSLRTDASLYTNFNQFQPMLTPKIGIGILGLSVFYGRNIPLNNHASFQGISSNQLAISISFIGFPIRGCLSPHDVELRNKDENKD